MKPVSTLTAGRGADPRPNPATPGLVPGLVHAFRIHADGRAEELPVDGQLDWSSADGTWCWLHFNLGDTRVANWLGDLAGLPPEARALLTAHHDHQKLHAIAGCVYGVIADLARDFDRDLNETGFLCFALTERFVISGRRHPLQSVTLVRQSLRDGQRVATTSMLIDVIIDCAASGIDRLVEDLGREADSIEDQILTGRLSDERRRLGELRRTGVRLHRQLAGLRTLFHRFERSGRAEVNRGLRLSIGQLGQRLDALDHEVVAIQERARLLQEEIGAKIAEESNRHLHVLSIVTALLLPPTLVFGIFGMNTRDLPFSATAGGTLWAVLLGVAAAAVAYLLLRRILKPR